MVNNIAPTTKPEVMLDLETLGTGDHAAIIQIAAVRFWPKENLINSPEGAFSVNIDLDATESQDLGKLDVQTVLWWMKQDPAARSRAFDQTNAFPMHPSLVALDEWLRIDGGCSKFWSDSTFDYRLVRQAFERNKVGDFADSIRFYKAFDWRTLKMVGNKLGVDEPMFVGDRHVALNDAFHQAGWAMSILRRLDSLKHVGPDEKVSIGQVPPSQR